MNRRDFFKRLSAVPIGAALAVDPLARTFFLPPPGGWVSSRLTGNTAWFLKGGPHELQYVYRTRALAASLLETKEFVAARVLSVADFKRIVEPQLREVFEKRYSEEWVRVFGSEGL